MNDTEIIGLFFARNERAIRETEVRYGQLCMQIAHRILGNRSDAEECVNDTYLALWNTIPPESPAHLSAYACAITRRLSLKRLEYNRAAKRDPAFTVSLEELEEILPAKEEDVLDAQALAALLDRFFAELPPTQRQVFLRKYWFFDSIEEIARRFGFSKPKVKSMLFHTRNKLKAFLKKEGVHL